MYYKWLTTEKCYIDGYTVVVEQRDGKVMAPGYWTWHILDPSGSIMTLLELAYGYDKTKNLCKVAAFDWLRANGVKITEDDYSRKDLI